MKSLPFASRKVLVLNKGYTAIGVVSLERAVVMLFSTYYDTTTGKDIPKAVALDHRLEPDAPIRSYTPRTWSEWSSIRPAEGDGVMRSCDGEFCIPQIIKLNRYEKLPQQKVHFSRKTIYERDSRKCQYCKSKSSPSELSIDHIVPRSRGGLTSWENCCLACVYCNKCKADRMPTREIESVRTDSGRQDVTFYTVYFKDDKKTWSKKIQQPVKPKFNFFRTGIQYESWKDWLSEEYWNTELDNDNDD